MPPNVPHNLPNWPRVIAHADMDAFFAAVEMLDDPALRTVPLVVGGLGPRAVVATANYIARRFGIGSAMPMSVARRRCADLVIRAPRFARYKEVSRCIMGLFQTFAHQIEPLSIDEAFLDMTGAERDWASPEALGHALRRAVFDATGLTVSVGIGDTKFVAKVASDVHKPNGLTVVPPSDAVAFLAPLPVSRLWGAGPKTVERLNALGLQTIGDVAAADPGWLSAGLGRAGQHFYRLAHNDDPRPLRPRRDPKSVGCEHTLAADIDGVSDAMPHLIAAAEEVARRLKAQKLRAGAVRVKLKTASFQNMSRQMQLPQPTDDPASLQRAGFSLLAQFNIGEPLRLVGLTGFDLRGTNGPEQLELWPDGPTPYAE